MRALGEVQEMIRQKLLRQQAMDLAARQGRALLEQLQRGDKPTLNWTAAQAIGRAQQGSLDKELVRKIFQADAVKLPRYVGAETPQNGYLLVRIEAVKEAGKPVDAKRVGYAQQLRQLTGEEMLKAFLADARQQAAVKVTLPEKAPGN